MRIHSPDTFLPPPHAHSTPTAEPIRNLRRPLAGYLARFPCPGDSGWQITGAGVRPVIVGRLGRDPAGHAIARVFRRLRRGPGTGRHAPGASTAALADLFATEAAARMAYAQRHAARHRPALPAHRQAVALFLVTRPQEAS